MHFRNWCRNGATLEFVVAQNGQLISGKLIAPGSYSGSDAELPSVWERPFRSRWDGQRFEPAGAGSPHTTHFGRGFKLRRKLSIRNLYPNRRYGERRHHRTMMRRPSTPV